MHHGRILTTVLSGALLFASAKVHAQAITWSTPVNVSKDDLATDRTPALAVGADSSGVVRMHVIYQNLDERELYHAWAELTTFSNWRLEQLTDHTRPGWPDCGSWDPAVALDSSGVVKVAYQARFSGADPEIMLTDNAGGSFRPPSYVTSDIWDDLDPDLTCWRDSTWVTYAGQGGNAPDTDQEIWLGDTQLTDNSSEEAAPRVVADSAGHLHLVFAGNGSGGRIGIYYATNASGSWDTTRVIGPDAFNSNPDIALDSTGAAHIVWERSVNGAQFDIYYATNKTGTFDTTRLTRTDSDEHTPVIAVDPQGFCHVVYQGSAGDPPDEVILYTNNRGGAFTSVTGASQRISPDSLADARYPDIAIGPRGHIHVVYQASNGRNTDIYYTRSVETVPVELVLATATRVDRGIRLHWVTASEENVAGFAIERRGNGGWQQIAFVPGNGTSSETHDYVFVDVNPSPEAALYRLVEVTTEGQRTILAEMKATPAVPRRFHVSRAYPNPFNPSTSFQFELPATGAVRVQVFNARGQRVYDNSLGKLARGKHRYTWQAEVPSGVYFVRFVFRSGGKEQLSPVQKVVLLR